MKDFWRSSSYFSSIVISTIFYHVECGDGRQPRILVDNLLTPKSKTRVLLPGFSQIWQSHCYYFFPPLLSNTSLCLFFCQGISLSKYLWIFTSNISPHFVEFAGIKLAITSASYILTALFLKFNKCEKIYYRWIFQTFIHRLKKKKKQRKEANFNCKWCISLLIEHW